MVARLRSSGKSIVMIVTISYFLSLDFGHPARAPSDARGGRAPRQLLAGGARAPAHAAGRQYAGAPARAGARAPAAPARRQADLHHQGGRAAPGPRPASPGGALSRPPARSPA